MQNDDDTSGRAPTVAGHAARAAHGARGARPDRDVHGARGARLARSTRAARDDWSRHAAAAALAAALCLAALFALFPDFDLDIWWHMRAGRMILAEGRVPHEDVFTYTATGRSWVTHEWLSEVLFYVLHRLGGFDLLSFFRSVLAAGALALGAWAGLVGGAGGSGRAGPGAGPGAVGRAGPGAGTAGSERGARLTTAALGVILAAPLIGVRALARPHLLTMFFLGLALLMLRLESTRGERRWRLWLLPLFIVWANVHSGFVQGFVLVALYWIGETLSPAWRWPGTAVASAVQDDPDRRGGRGAPLGALCRRLAAPLLAPGWRGRACAFGSIVLVTLINPNHVHALLYPFQLAGRREFTDIIVELRSLLHPDYHGALFVWAFAAAAAVIVVFAALARRRVVPALLIPTVVFGLLGVRFLRGVGEFAPLVPAFLAAHGAWLGRGRRLVPTAALAVIGLTLACAAGVLWRGIPMGAAPPLRIGLGVDGRTVPAGAVRFIAEAPVPGRVFNFMSFGSYMIHELWPGKQVYIDGRLEVFPEGFLRDYRRMQDTGAGWDEAVARYGIAAAIVPYEEGPATSGGGGTAGDASGGAAGGAKGGATGGAAGGATGGLLARLRTDPDWSCVYFGEIAIVYARHVPETAELLRRFGSRFDPNLRSIESVDAFVASASPEDLAQAVSALGEMTRITPDELAPAMALGLLLDGAGRPEEAVEAFRQVVRLQPRSLQPRLQIAGALARAGQFDLARREAEEAERCAPRSAEPFLLLAEIERTQGRLPAAAAALERALALDARNYLIPLRLGALNGQMGRLDLAREYLNRAARLKPGDPAVIQNLEMLRRAESGQRGN